MQRQIPIGRNFQPLQTPFNPKFLPLPTASSTSENPNLLFLVMAPENVGAAAQFNFISSYSIPTQENHNLRYLPWYQDFPNVTIISDDLTS